MDEVAFRFSFSKIRAPYLNRTSDYFSARLDENIFGIITSG